MGQGSGGIDMSKKRLERVMEQNEGTVLIEFDRKVILLHTFKSCVSVPEEEIQKFADEVGVSLETFMEMGYPIEVSKMTSLSDKYNGNYEGTEYEVDTAWEVVDDDEYLENFTYTVEEPEED